MLKAAVCKLYALNLLCRTLDEGNICVAFEKLPRKSTRQVSHYEPYRLGDLYVLKSYF